MGEERERKKEEKVEVRLDLVGGRYGHPWMRGLVRIELVR
jgi:hypothetical protein